MVSKDFLSGDQTPVRKGSSSSSTSTAANNNDTVDSFRKRMDDDAASRDGNMDDDSFVTMAEENQEVNNDEEEEINVQTPSRSELEYEDDAHVGATIAVDSKRPSKVSLKNTNGQYSEGQQADYPKKSSSFRRLSHHLSRELVRRRSSIVEQLPDTPAGWTVLVSSLASALLGYELHLQQQLSCPPLVFGQCTSDSDETLPHNTKTPANLPLQSIYEQLTQTPQSLLSRPIHPSLFVGTRGTLASVAAYALHGPPAKDQKFCFRQVLTMSADGATIALDWELPSTLQPTISSATSSLSAVTQGNNDKSLKQKVLSTGGIEVPVILILTGMNNDTSFGYVKSLMRSYTDRGWISVAMNFRGVGGVPLTTPRCYNGGYTGDLRNVVQYLESRLAPSVPLFLVRLYTAVVP